MNEKKKQTANRGVSSGTWKYPVEGEEWQEHRPGSQQSRKSLQEVREPGNGFLTSVFRPIAIHEIGGTHYSEESYDYLLRSAKRYAKLSGKELPVDCQEVNYSRLFETVRDNLLKERQQLDIIKKDGKLKFMISDDQASCLIYFIPCKVIDKVKGELRDIIISFFSIFQSCQNLEPLENNPILGYWRHDFEAPGACDRDWIKELRCYFKGRKKKRLDLIKEKSKYTLKELKNRIADYKTNSRKYKRLLELMAEGLGLFSKGKILSFEAEPYTDEEFYAEYYPVEMNRLIQIVYDTDDWFTENMIEWTNNEAGEQWYNYLSSEHFILSPQSKRIFRENEFLKSYLDWLVRFINVLR
ncbi:hypothetical protein [Dysgonomonas sp. 25]|uniref:hypothetical protein n=1 Tax=Dysgonomonas sp. 25 TaxID=2302933 RepID=UPI0013D1636D|nr:hypothetical protein [Dysgonomonas sp. 25]NDV69960.1 hypothetical protein [Dysgonomonas sp. 25]